MMRENLYAYIKETIKILEKNKLWKLEKKDVHTTSNVIRRQWKT